MGRFWSLHVNCEILLPSFFLFWGGRWRSALYLAPMEVRFLACLQPLVLMLICHSQDHLCILQAPTVLEGDNGAQFRAQSWPLLTPDDTFLHGPAWNYSVIHVLYCGSRRIAVSSLGKAGMTPTKLLPHLPDPGIHLEEQSRRLRVSRCIVGHSSCARSSSLLSSALQKRPAKLPSRIRIVRQSCWLPDITWHVQRLIPSVSI
jgi:hypothetical protein